MKSSPASIGPVDWKELDRESPTFWAQAFQGTPMAIMVPPYIRFLQGTLMLRKAQTLLHLVELEAMAGHEKLAPVYQEMEFSKDAKALGLDFEAFFASHLTINLVSEVEHFFGSVVSVVLRMYPAKMGTQTFKLAEIVAATTTDELIDRAARAVVNELMYERPSEYLKKLAGILSIDAKQFEDTWPQFVELKARRDLGVHNNWRCNEIYLRKVREVGVDSPYKIGDDLTPRFEYLVDATDVCTRLVDRMANVLGAKWLPAVKEQSDRASQASPDGKPTGSSSES